MIICGGENVCSPEVDWVLYSHLVVNEAALVAKPDGLWGETPCAFVSLRNNGLGLDCSVPSERDRTEFCRERLPH